MKSTLPIFNIVFLLFLLYAHSLFSQRRPVDLEVSLEINLGTEIGKLRAIPVQLRKNQEAFLFIYSKDKEIDPWIEMFYPPTDRLKMALYSKEGQLIWKKKLGKGVINGIWFTPVYSFDLDDNGTDEIYFVNNTDSVHILSYNALRLEVLDAGTGEPIASLPWYRAENGSLSHTFRNFIFGGYVAGVPVLVTAQGTYGDMALQAWDTGFEKRWDLNISADEPGARGSHMSPVIDLDGDGLDEILWGERCINLEDGTYEFIADKDLYNGHSDVIQPTLDWSENQWYIFTCRESGDKGQIKPRVIMFDDHGARVWTDLDEGHMDMGWTAQRGVNEEPLAFTISRGAKIAGPDGFYRTDVVEYAYDAFSGNKIEPGFRAYNTVPVDMDGDGFHEFASALDEQATRKVYGADGDILADLGEGAYIAMASKMLDFPGEQILCYYPDGTIRIWYNKNAIDSDRALKRYSHNYYQACRRLTATGYNLINLGGL